MELWDPGILRLISRNAVNCQPDFLPTPPSIRCTVQYVYALHHVFSPRPYPHPCIHIDNHYTMSFKDMVKAAAEAERQRRQRMRDEQAPQTELAEATTLDNSPPDSELPKAATLATEAPQKGRLSEVLNFNSDTQREG
jgi:hypothetical protein